MKLLIIILCIVLGSVSLIRQYERHVTRQLADALDAKYGTTGWTVSWITADAQPGQSLSLIRTTYVRFLHPRFKECTPWSRLEFTHKTTTPNRPWHYGVCVISRSREETYYWSIVDGRWVIAWNNRITDSPASIQRAYADKLKSISRREGLNWSDD